MLNGLLHYNGNQGGEVTCCIEVLPTTPHSAMAISAVAKPWKEKLQKSLYFLTYPRTEQSSCGISHQLSQCFSWLKYSRPNIQS
ncbi:hypothetical protein TNCV_2843931 [Trichonephila clavipes]|nr:hypothetical protein TNCV_2843931 [Trichonephila clavipes]